MIVLDTHVLIWAMEGDGRLGSQSGRLIEDAAREAGLFVSAITPWEVAMSTEKGRLALGRDVGAWLGAALALPGIRLAPITPTVAIDSVRLPGDFHADPADRLIIATARELGAPLLTAERAILDYGNKGHVVARDATADAGTPCTGQVNATASDDPQPH